MFLCLPFFLVPLAGAAQVKQDGVASYYGSKFHGKRTASGEIFDKQEMTAAHKSLPFGTILKVTRIDNGDFIYVRVNDRGPFVGGRIIDLSRAAADRLSIIRAGKKKVRIEIVEDVQDVTALLEQQTLNPVHLSEVGEAMEPVGTETVVLASAHVRPGDIAPVLEKKMHLPREIPPSDRKEASWIKNAVEALFPKKGASKG